MKKRKMKSLITGLVTVIGCIGTMTQSVFISSAQTVEEYAAYMDAPLLIYDTGTVEKKRSNETFDEEPRVEISKGAEWLDIEKGFAQIVLTEEDTPGYADQSVDYFIILDRTRTMSLNDKNFEGSPANDVGSGNSPCLNREHYYEYSGKMVDLYDYEHGVARGENEVLKIPNDSSLYKYHRNAEGKKISVDYSNGCIDRLTIAKDTICGLIDKIAANSPTGKGMENRVSYWSFAGTYWPEKEGEIDTDHERGLFNYIDLTNDFAQVKRSVQATNSYAGTYYMESLKKACEQLENRTGVYQSRPAKVIFISDGKSADDEQELTEWVDRLNAIPNCTVYTLAVGMPVSSAGAVLLKNMSTNKDSSTFAAFTTNLNSSNPAFAETLTSIAEAKVQVKASEKVLTDKLDTRYWEFVEVLEADGEAAVEEDQLIWKIPEEPGALHTCRLKIRLKEEYRFLASDTEYPTNLDETQSLGCKLEYRIRGGRYHGEVRTREKETPYLKYGTVHTIGKKEFLVPGAEAESVKFLLSRQLKEGEPVSLAEAVVTKEGGWQYTFDSRYEGEELLPLVLYTNEEERWNYFLSEEVQAYYLQVNREQSESDGKLQTVFYNEPYKIKAAVTKLDAETGEPLSGAVFGVYAYSKTENRYIPYCVGDGSTAGENRLFEETEPGKYVTEGWLYYTPDNEGKFRIMEEVPPKGYLGDFVDDDETKGLRSYDICITGENNGSVLETDKNGVPLTVANRRDPKVPARIRILKKDKTTGAYLQNGTAGFVIKDVTGAWKNEYYNEASLLEKAEYTLKYDGLVVEYDEEEKIWRGSYEHPFEAKSALYNGETVLLAETQKELPVGTYELEEVMAPEGYILPGSEGRIAIAEDGLREIGEDIISQNGTYYETEEDGMWKETPAAPVTFTVGNGEGHYDREQKCWWTEVQQEDTPAIGKVSVKVMKEVYIKNKNGKNTGKKQRVPKVAEKLLLYAEEDIVSADGRVIHPAGTLIKTLVTNEQGTAWTGDGNGEDGFPEGLYPGIYRICWPGEDEERIVKITYKDDETPVIYKDEVFLLSLPSKSTVAKETPGSIPKTGDNTPLWLLTTAMGCGLWVSAGILYKNKRRRSH